MVGVEGRQIVYMTATEFGVFLEQALLQIEAECLGLLIYIAFGNFLVGEAINLTILEQYVVQGLALEFR